MDSIIQPITNLDQARATDARASALAGTLDTCPYDQVRDRMLDIELMYGGNRSDVPPVLAAEIGRRLRLRKDYHLLAAWNGLPPGTGTPKPVEGPGLIARVTRLFTGWSKP